MTKPIRWKWRNYDECDNDMIMEGDDGEPVLTACSCADVSHSNAALIEAAPLMMEAMRNMEIAFGNNFLQSLDMYIPEDAVAVIKEAMDAADEIEALREEESND